MYYLFNLFAVKWNQYHILNEYVQQYVGGGWVMIGKHIFWNDDSHLMLLGPFSDFVEY